MTTDCIKKSEIQPMVEKYSWELTSDFMDKLKVGDTFSLNSKTFFVKCVGKWKSDYFTKQEFKTVTLKCNEDGKNIKFFYFFGYEGNPKVKGRTASVRQDQFVRDVEGVLIVDLLNKNNRFHENSDIYKLAIR